MYTKNSSKHTAYCYLQHHIDFVVQYIISKMIYSVIAFLNEKTEFLYNTSSINVFSVSVNKNLLMFRWVLCYFVSPKIWSRIFAISFISTGFTICPFMPHSKALFLSSSKAFAVIATIGILAFLLLANVRISLVAV